MGSICGESSVDFDGQDEEKIYVAIRLRPLNERELSKNDVSEWECINNTTILFKNTFQERTLLPTAYTFDRIFGYDSPTRQVYDDAAKKIALSVLNGINSTIFAYGQTSSGKTYTMSGITEYTIEDIYDYINMHSEREFKLKFSAMEIYNESVRDLLVMDCTPLRLLDDPERGTVVDKLTEVNLTDYNHLKELLSICEAQRQNGETTLNEVSSRSHQILRLTVESEARQYKGAGSSSLLTASVNFVDLAGSERASQTLSAGTRLKEGCHINRSLLTLGTVIRKLSKGRNGHVPYRDSKLTRILQNSLGGNARTAIICTMSPAHSHLEQSRNTLLFASCAKQVSTNAQVNVVMSEKALVKQLQKELARLENELKNLSSTAASCGSSSVLKEKELLIDKMDKEIKELTHQRDLAQSRVEDMLRSASITEYNPSKSWVDMHNHEKSSSWASEYAPSEMSDIIDPTSRTPHISEAVVRSSAIEDNFPEQFLSGDTSPGLYIDKYFGPDPCRGWEKMAAVQGQSNGFEENCKEVQCIETDFVNRSVESNSDSPRKERPTRLPHDESYSAKRSRSLSALTSPQNGAQVSGISSDNDAYFIKSETISGLPSDDGVYFAERKTISIPPSPQKDAQVSDRSPFSSDNDSSDTGVNVPRSQSCAAILTTVTKSPSLEPEEEDEDEEEEKEEEEKDHGFHDKSSSQEQLSDAGPKANKSWNLCREDSEKSDRSDCLNDDEDQIIMTFGKNDRKKEAPILIENKEVVELKSVKHVDYDPEMVEEKKPNQPEEKHAIAKAITSDKTPDTEKSASDWQAEYEKQMTQIIELWDACHIPLIHRSYFFLLFKGDPSDAVYLEVELRRLSFLKNMKHGVHTIKNGSISMPASSAKNLNRERVMLSKHMLKKYSAKEREALFKKWGIELKSKQRRLQLCRLLWTDNKNTEHVKESASIVARLVGFKEPSQAPKEMFGLSFVPARNGSFSWRKSLPPMM
ncbi:kinesin-related protein [Striga asiatica]|uniref:Kinesin-like protein n=1 Tax=Striga asiatica TaxID=4170 RepID=A0A5A7P1F4_STRAF|nr:kinesin-related protein [Striga asiatica]